MPRCLVCKKQIDYLTHYVSGTIESRYDGGEHELVNIENEDDDIYCCPECGRTLFRRYDDADKFLDRMI